MPNLDTAVVFYVFDQVIYAGQLDRGSYETLALQCASFAACAIHWTYNTLAAINTGVSVRLVEES